LETRNRHHDPDALGHQFSRTSKVAIQHGRNSHMWAQLITTRLKPGREGDLPKLIAELEAVEQPGSGLLRSTALVDQKDPLRVYMLVVFESEEKARAREQDSRRQEGLVRARAMMAEIFDGPPEFSDLSVANERVY
jgi:hypothetical protein